MVSVIWRRISAIVMPVTIRTTTKIWASSARVSGSATLAIGP